MAPRVANWVHAVALLLANSIRAVPCIDPKHKGERQIKLEEDHIKVKTDRLRVNKKHKKSKYFRSEQI